MRTRRDWMRWGALAILSAVTSQHVGAAPSCADLAKPGLFPNAVVQTATVVAADAKTGMPAYCEVTALITPVAGSKITAVYRLPENWNGRMLGLGGGGWAGILNLLQPAAISGPFRAASPGLTRGYATAQTDGGHSSPFVTDASWTRNNPVAVTDFSHRAIHEMTVLGKQVVASHYGRAATKNYYQACSQGGRMGMMETQRYPDDYDGVVAGAPVYSLLVQSSSVVRDQIFKAPGAAISIEHIKLVHDAVLSACDAKDGLKDGVVTDPRRCDWEPKSLQCKSGVADSSCLTPSQVNAVNKAYQTVRTRTDVVGNYGLTRGSEAGWNPFVSTTPGPRNVLNGDLGDIIPLMFGDSAFDPATFDIEKQQAAIHRTPFAAEYEANSTDLSKFFNRGGKLLLWHGLDDPAPSPFATIDYYERTVKANGGESVRFFALPGVYHCGGGPGADSFDPLTALEQWVEHGAAPETMVATNRTSGIERPVCAWPKLPYYRSGDPSKAGSFVCR
jgi:Tannase and feruloyl esterase